MFMPPYRRDIKRLRTYIIPLRRKNKVSLVQLYTGLLHHIEDHAVELLFIKHNGVDFYPDELQAGNGGLC